MRNQVVIHTRHLIQLNGNAHKPRQGGGTVGVGQTSHSHKSVKRTFLEQSLCRKLGPKPSIGKH